MQIYSFSLTFHQIKELNKEKKCFFANLTAKNIALH